MQSAQPEQMLERRFVRPSDQISKLEPSDIKVGHRQNAGQLKGLNVPCISSPPTPSDSPDCVLPFHERH
jgi:hypothetical protein